MNRIVVLGVAMFFALVGIALVGGENKASAVLSVASPVFGCGGCDGCGGCNGGGCHGGCNGGGCHRGRCHGRDRVPRSRSLPWT